jgi:CheY-like chemotaxis protein
MNAIIGLTRMSQQSDNLTEIHQHLDNISSSSGYLLLLLNDILDISKIEAGRMTLESANIFPVALIDNVQSMITPQAEAKNLNLTVSVAPELPACIICDGTRLTQVIMNLLSNAVKFTPEGGSVELTASLQGTEGGKARLQFSVADTGIGIEKAGIEKLFTPFVQAEEATSRKYGGTGLGLAISKLLVEMMGGSIQVVSVPGKGSTFAFNILAEISELGAEDQADDMHLDEELQNCIGRCFLVVEDNEINRIIAANALEQFGADVDFAENGKEAVEKFKNAPEKYDIIFMDIQMPVMNGYDATRAIRACGIPGSKEISIIAMSANVFKEDVDACMEAGMDAHVSKPFDLKDLARTIRKALKDGEGLKFRKENI